MRNEGALDLDSKISSDADCILIPILCDSFEGYEVIESSLEVQEHRETDYRELLKIPEGLKEELLNSYDIIGDVLIVKLTDGLLEYKCEIGDALMSVTPNIRTVMLDSGVKGDFRIRDLEQISGTGSSETIHREFGTRMITDPARSTSTPVYAQSVPEWHRWSKKGRP